METVQFKFSSGDLAEDFNAVFVTPAPVEDAYSYEDINWNKRKISNAIWQAWEIKFGFLTVAKMDYLLQLKTKTAPQMIYNTVTYNIQLLSSPQVKTTGGSIKVVKVEAE